MKKSWEIKRLVEVCLIKGRIGYRGYTKNDIVMKGEGAITLSPSNIKDNKLNFENSTYISWFKYDESPEIIINEGDIIYCKTASIGKMALVEHLPEKATINPQFVVLKNFNCLNRFLYYFMISEDFKKKIFGITGGTAIPTLSQENLGNLEIPVPPLTEQKSIVYILDEAFAGIEQAKENLQRNLQNAKDLFQSEKNQVFENLAKTEGKVPIASVCNEIFAGGDAPKENFSDEKTEKYPIPIFANAVGRKGLYGFTDVSRVTEPSITIAGRGSGTGYTEIRYEPFFPIVRLIVLTPNIEKITLEFLKYAIQSLTILKSGSAIPQLTIPMIKGYSLPLPSLKEQKKIVYQFDTLEVETKNLENIYQQKLNALEELKKSILQKAFSGQLSKSGLSGLKDGQDFKTGKSVKQNPLILKSSKS